MVFIAFSAGLLRAEDAERDMQPGRDLQGIQEIKPVLVVERVPDFEPVDLYIADRRLIVAVLNKGAAYDGKLVFRVGVQESAVPQTGDFRFDRITELQIKLAAGGVGIYDMGEVVWPNAAYPALDHPEVRFAVLVNPDNKVSEANVHNNRIERTIRRDCGLKISQVKPDKFIEGLPSLLSLYGTFGYAEKNKRVILRQGERERVLTVADWEPNRLRAVLPKDIPPGDYEVLVACSEKCSGVGYFTSNIVGISIVMQVPESAP